MGRLARPTGTLRAGQGRNEASTAVRGGPALARVLADPGGREREQREPEEQVQVGPEDPAVHPVRGVQQVVVVVPVDAHVHEAEQVREEHRHERAQRGQAGVVRRAQLVYVAVAALWFIPDRRIESALQAETRTK